MSLGLIIVGLLFTIYVASEKNNRIRSALSTIQDNETNAISLLNRGLHQAGYIGCAHLSDHFPVIPYQDYSIHSNNKLIGNENELTVRFMDYFTVILKDIRHSIIYTTNEVKFSAGDILIISNCRQAEIFEVHSNFITSFYQKIIPKYPLQLPFYGYAEIGRLIINRYFIAKTKRTDLYGHPIYALYVRDIHERKTELVEGVNQMQLTYLVKTNNRLMDVAANSINDWAKVVGVNINLTLVSSSLKKHWYSDVALR